jgi:hypothetical protein
MAADMSADKIPADAEIAAIRAIAPSRPCLLVVDTTPIYRLAAITGGLDRLFVPGLEVCLPDILLLSDHPGGEGAIIDSWLAVNRPRLRESKTSLGESRVAAERSYQRTSALWELARRPPEYEPERPDWTEWERDDLIWVAAPTLDRMWRQGLAVIALTDDEEMRRLIGLKVARMCEKTPFCLASTQTFLRWLAEDYDTCSP